MPTAYLRDRDHLVSLIGAGSLQQATRALGLEDIEPVIDSQNALADGYVSAQVQLPPSAQAIEQVAPLVAELVYTALFLGNANEQVTKRREQALKALRDVATGTVRLHVEPVVDDPATPQDESNTVADFGAAPRQTRYPAVTGTPFDW